MPGVAGQLPVEEFQEVTLVVGPGQGVHDGEAVNLLVIEHLDVVAGEVTKDAGANADVIAVAKAVGGGGAIVDEGAVGATQVDEVVPARGGADLGMAAGDGVVFEADLAGAFATDDQGVVAKGSGSAESGSMG